METNSVEWKLPSILIKMAYHLESLTVANVQFILIISFDEKKATNVYEMKIEMCNKDKRKQ